MGLFENKIFAHRCLGCVCALTLALAGASQAKNIYVKASANGDGSESNPYGSIAKAASVAAAGDIILVSGGTYSEKSIVPKSSGTDKALIVFRPKSSSDEVIIKHPATSTNDNTPIFDLSNRNYIQIEGFTFKDFKFGKASIYISNGTNNFVLNNRFVNLGRKEEAASWDGNQMVGLFNSQYNAVCNNYFENIVGDGINVNSSKTKYNLVCDNTFINFQGKLRSWGGQYLYSRAIDIQDMSQGDNLIAFNSSKKGIQHVWMDRNGSGNVILRNYGEDGTGLVFNESRCSTNVVQENVAVRMETGYMTAYYSGTGDSYKARYINNVAYENGYGFKMHKTEKDEVRNNIVANSKNYSIEFTQTALYAGPYTFKNNLWYSTKSNSMQFKGSGTTVSNFQSGVGEKNGLSVDPKFTNAASGDFTLASNSPGKNAGDNGYDIGAYPVYGPSGAGWNSGYKFSDAQVFFGTSISSVSRTQQLKLDVKLSMASTETVTVNVTPIAGDAKEGVDFSLTKAVTFKPGETSKTVTIQFGGSAPFDELVAFRLTNPANAQVGARRLHAVRVKSGEGGEVAPPEPIEQKPFGGVAHAIPGTIEFEDYDEGGEGESFHDSDYENKGGAYRSDAVDIEEREDTPGETSINWVTAGEWLEFTVDVAKAGNYDIEIDFACNGEGRTMSLSMDDESIASNIEIPNTEGWGNWKKITIPNISLKAGKQVLRWTMGDTDYVNLNKMIFTETGTTKIAKMAPVAAMQLKRKAGKFEIVGASENARIVVHDLMGNRIYSSRGSSSFEIGSYSGVVLITVSDPRMGVAKFKSVVP